MISCDDSLTAKPVSDLALNIKFRADASLDPGIVAWPSLDLPAWAVLQVCLHALAHMSPQD